MSELSVSKLDVSELNTPIHDDYAKLERLYSRWLVGDGGVINTKDLPSDFIHILQSVADNKKSLFAMALASQYQALMLSHEPILSSDDVHDNPLQPYPLLPLLEHKILPVGLQPLARRILLAFDRQMDIASLFLTFLAQRGYVLTPNDALPVLKFWLSNQDCPTVYLPWLGWLNWTQNQTKDYQATQLDELTLENWDDWYPSELSKTLKQLRQTNPQQALELITEGIKRSQADTRLKVVSTLSVNLNEQDKALLESLTTDRSQKVASLAKHLLARLGVFAQNSESENIATELANGFELKEAVLKSVRLAPKKLKSGRQMAMRAEQLGRVHLPAFANALGLKLSELITAWQFGDHQPTDNCNLLDNMTATLSEADFEILVNHLSGYIVKNPNDFIMINRLEQRLDKPMRRQMTERLLRANVSFADIARLSDGVLLVEKLEKITHSPYWQTLTDDIQKQIKDNGYLSNWQAMQLQMLGLLVSEDVAKALFNKLVVMGVPRTDNGLMVLNLNQRLSEKG